MRSMMTAVLLLVVAGSAHGQALDSYDAEMHGQWVIPPVTGTGWAQMESAFESAGPCGMEQSDSLWVYLYYSQLTGDPTGCYIHRGDMQSNGERLYTLAEGYFPGGTLPYRIYIDPADCEDMSNFGLYVVITTDAYPDGEVRGQIEYHPFQPVERSTWGRVRRLYR